MALEKLLASLEAKAADEANVLRRDAAARAASLAQAAGERRARVLRETLEARERGQRLAADQAVARARRAARTRVLTARAQLLDRVFEAARALLPAAASSPPFRAALPGRLVAAQESIGDTAAELRAAADLLPLIRAASPNHDVTFAADPAVTTGFVLAARDGALEVDETLQSRLARLRPTLSLAVLEALRAEPGA